MLIHYKINFSYTESCKIKRKKDEEILIKYFRCKFVQLLATGVLI